MKSMARGARPLVGAKQVKASVRLLIVEDEVRIAELLKHGLEAAGFAVDAVRLCADARDVLSVTGYDAAILDLGLPDGDGISLLSELRASGNRDGEDDGGEDDEERMGRPDPEGGGPNSKEMVPLVDATAAAMSEALTSSKRSS